MYDKTCFLWKTCEEKNSIFFCIWETEKTEWKAYSVLTDTPPPLQWSNTNHDNLYTLPAPHIHMNVHSHSDQHYYSQDQT